MKKKDKRRRRSGNLVAHDATRVSPDTIIALVRNGSTGEPRSTGYWLFEVLAADVEREDLIPPLWGTLLPAVWDFRSGKSQILGAVNSGREGVEDRSI